MSDPIGRMQSGYPLVSSPDELETALMEWGRRHLDAESVTMLVRALTVAKQAHAGQVRDDGTPYITHPLRVALSLAQEFDVDDLELICAALLHDAVEDAAHLSTEQIEWDFGPRVGHIVQQLTKPSDPLLVRAEVNRIYFDRLAQADEDCKLVKLADKLDNLRDAVNSPNLTKRRRTAEEAQKFYLALAQGLEDALRRQRVLERINQALDEIIAASD
jgi:(p)ppGpp synthase/HD superfamily hydrolase